MVKFRVFMLILVSAFISDGVYAASSGDGRDDGEWDQTVHELEGLEDTVEILVDQWGIPHIYASSQDDVYFAQGFNVARDRLFQIDIWRKNGVGELSESFGEEYLEQDIAKRSFLYRGSMEEEWDADTYGPDTQSIVTSFTDGINAYIELTEQNPEMLPEEFRILDFKPSKWEPEDVVRIRSHGLTRNVTEEVTRALTLHQHGEEAEAMRNQLEPELEMTIPEGLALDDITEEILDYYHLATEGVSFEGLENHTVTENKSTSELVELTEQLRNQSNLGSNNWVIGAEKSATGRPIMADDPHRSVDVPSLRYITHLSSPEMDVIGGGEPVLPGISIGHNGISAWGLTIFAIDQEDLFVYETNPDNPLEYQYAGEWEQMEVVEESIEVKDGDTHHAEMEFTRHGPVIYKDEENDLAFAVKAAWLEPGMAPYLGGLSYMSAESWDDFYESMNHWGSPSENQVYADQNGDIGWKPGGLTPIRDNWDGLLPVPGDGTYEWNGFLDQNLLPYEYNPEKNWFATANEMNLPEGYDEYHIGYDQWASPFRYQRIEEVLNQSEQFSIEDSLALQTDYISKPGQRITELLNNLESSDEKVNQGINLLLEWDGDLSTDSAGGALFEIWYQRYLGEAVVKEVLPEEAAEDVGSGDPIAVLDLLEQPDERFGSEPETVRDEILLSTLEDAINETEELLGEDMENWIWGDLKHSYLEHPLSTILSDEQKEQMNVGPLPRGGSGDTVGASGYNENFQQVSGATFRLVIDVGEWDNSIAMNSPGQSEDPMSNHYDNLFEMWANDEAFPLLYSRDKIEEATVKQILLEPQSK